MYLYRLIFTQNCLRMSRIIRNFAQYSSLSALSMKMTKLQIFTALRRLLKVALIMVAMAYSAPLARANDVDSVQVLSAAVMCQKGNDLYNNRKYKEAVEWYRQAAEQGSAAAQCNLGSCYLHGRGVEQSDRQ